MKKTLSSIRLHRAAHIRAGQVYLIGAGPGDPGLLTVRAHNLLQSCDVVLYDRLVNPEILKIAARAAHIPVGKSPGKTCRSRQESIQQLLIRYARAGCAVVRLKGGDPFVFGRGGEEALALSEAGISFEIVPGISSMVAVPALAGIPVTHRGVANAFAVFTGHAGEAQNEIDWELAARIPTAVFLMGVRMLPTIVRQLLEHGRPAHTPAALISRGSLPEQLTIIGTLNDIVAKVQGVQPPATLVVGEVVSIQSHLTQLISSAVSGAQSQSCGTQSQARTAETGS
ncbi:MAG: uroporphyrinogen-III C-methyltransferase [Leptospiraceae bacterium]|nr:uroporphyrinogen-III C-methyltransferase [Leptospiraceae bacterium]MCB1320850.1 uroporphyrinogen-III C-methyltransferase [Leptospiraceae bacterium]